MSEAPLHPRRIAAALKWLREIEQDLPGPIGMRAEDHETLRALLKVMQKAQAATGLTPGVVDAIGHASGVLDYVKKTLIPK